MANEVAPYNDKAVSLKAYLNKAGVKQALMDAAPRMFSIERFLKVFHGACMRNPKLLECTMESILQAAMACAQLGVEPILGRAYLVPYLNSKNVAGRWVKQYEVQLQIGYQGLVDLARRSDTISDVWAAVVYENDLFDLTYGMDRALVHRPWFMDPDKRKAGESGEIIGAYVVWQLKDGTKHPDYMPIDQIYKRREKSQSWHYAEFGDPKKGGGKRDSVWHMWEEEMVIKTVIKHSSKLVPASIEFMEAVEIDNAAETKGAQFEFATPQIAAPGNGFDAAAKAKGAGADFDAFIGATAKANGTSVEDFKQQVMDSGRFDELWQAFVSSRPQEKAGPDPSQGDNDNDDDPWARDKWIKLRSTGYRQFVIDNLATFDAAPPKIKAEAKGKWLSIYQDQEPWPEPGAEEQQAETGGNAEETGPDPLSPNSDEIDDLMKQLSVLSEALDGAYVLQAQQDGGYKVGIEHLDELAALGQVDALLDILERTADLVDKRGI